MTKKLRQDGTSAIPRHRRDTTGPAEPNSASCARMGEVLSRIGDKWSVMVVRLLKDGPRRFSELKREIGGVSQRMLTLTLRGLERDGLVTRKVFPTVPPRVDYELTRLGHSLRPPIEALGEWAVANLDAIEACRRKFDARAADGLAAEVKGVRRHLTARPRP